MPIEYRGIPSFLHLKKILTSGLLEDSLGLGMKVYLYTILVSSSNPEVSIFFRCRNEGIPLYYIGKILTSGLLKDANIV
jgi:hypothetical protein